MDICLITDNIWVKNSLVKLLDFEYKLFHFENFEKLINASYDHIFVDMQVNNNGGPSIVKELKRNEAFNNSKITLLIDREADIFQSKRVGTDNFLLKPIEKTNLKKIFT